ncbi:hypothetical protein DPMN_177912 [Dreissena polymorpha]|uniref:Uncharacterized protein n=1 Tax=Dreissena polymorpha TaxID=45954 RepID=A0A9D4ED35_DREPO|nr:hypothetical protein DPMN_177912 [Dreissena polymorpha]
MQCGVVQLMGAYSVSKTALLGLVKALVPQLTQMNIRVNAIAPGVIKTRFSEKVYLLLLFNPFMPSV